ncbi:MAG TPA: hypothetical protein VKM69_05290 [Natronoarchaeum rubrum]|nr:hypothetical protein [Natronoarchaeum rubrum]
MHIFPFIGGVEAGTARHFGALRARRSGLHSGVVTSPRPAGGIAV